MTPRILPIALAAAALAGPALAHHGWGSYDAARKLTIRAAVETLEWQNPHAHLTVKHEGVTWEATLAPLFRMQSRGLDAGMLSPGTEVVVEGYPSTRHANELRAERISVGGKTFELR